MTLTGRAIKNDATGINIGIGPDGNGKWILYTISTLNPNVPIVLAYFIDERAAGQTLDILVSLCNPRKVNEGDKIC